jgi:anti-anti-sigma factor
VTSESLADFGVSARFEGDQVVLAVRGEIGHLTAPVLRALFDAVMATGHHSVLLDLSDLGSMDASGLAMAAGVAGTLVASGGRLTIRSSSAEPARAFDVIWLSEVIELEVPFPRRDQLGREGVGAPLPPTPVLAGAEPNTKAVASFSANEQVVDAALGMAVAVARATVGGADGASVSLRRHGHLSTVAASDQTILDMDSEQYATGEGPCVDASVAGRWFPAESLEAETRWPAFVPRARALGIRAILSSPLVAGDSPVGALNIYSRTATAFAVRDQELAGILATGASTVLTAAGADVSDEQLASRVQEALRVRQMIAQAEGVIMERQNVDGKGAFDVLRRASGSSGLPLRDEARDVLDSSHRGERDFNPRSPGDRLG